MVRQGREYEHQPELVNHVDAQYLALLQDILTKGTVSKDRTGTGTIKTFGSQLEFDLLKGFPLLTTKNVWFKGVKEELLWMIGGERNIRSLVLKGVNIWNEWPLKKYLESQGMGHIHPKETPELWQEQMEMFIETIKVDEEFAEQWGDLGPVYGYLWRHWPTSDGGKIDQLANAIETIKNNPDSRRIIVTAWNPEFVDPSKVALPPCHMMYQFQVDGNELNCAMTQRSVDTFLGLPFNIASYALLTHLVAQITNKVPGKLTMELHDTHIYLDHLEQVKIQLSREAKPLPTLKLAPSVQNIDGISSNDISVENYNPHPAIKAAISV